jgi:hypothetical protein
MRTKLPLCAALLPSFVLGADLASYDFSLRLPTALSHQSAFGDVAAEGGTSAASIWGSSNNPASMSWGFQDNPNTHPLCGDTNYVVSGQYSRLNFGAGQELDYFSEAIILDMKDAGVLRLAYGTINSNISPTQTTGLGFDIESAGGRADWGYALSKDLRIGIGATYSDTQVALKAPGFDAVHVDRENWGVRAGVVGKMSERWMGGFYADYNHAVHDTTYLLPTPTGSLGALRTETSQDEWTFRPGVAYALDEQKISWLHFDYEWTHYTSDTQTFDNHRFLLGGDYLAFGLFHARAGTFVDARGNAGWSAGIGLHFPKQRTHIELAYQQNAFPEIRPEFGDSETLNLSIAIAW